MLSEGQQQTKVIKKISHALEHGTQMGWMIDPAEDCVIVYTPDLRAVLYQDAEQLLPVPGFAQGFQLKLGELISWLYE